MPDEQVILPRHLSAELHDALTYSRVVNIVGARQVGKTTLVRDILQTGRFISLDNDTVLEAIEGDPWGQLQRLMDGLKEGADEAWKRPEYAGHAPWHWRIDGAAADNS